MINPLMWIKTFSGKLKFSALANLVRRFPRAKSYFNRQARILYLVTKGYKKDSIYIKASALTFFTILSVVPLLALAFGISKGFGLDNTMNKVIIENFHNQKEVMDWLLKKANEALFETSGGALAGIGVVMLFYTVGQLLGYIERIFNSIWKVDQTRPWFRKITDYLTIIIIFPAVLIASSSATVLVNTRLNDVLGKYEILESLWPVISFILKILPFILLFLITTATYLVMPNAKVKYTCAITAGILAAIGIQVLQIFYLQLQMGAGKLGKIYGTFAAVPLLMIWVQMSWVVLLVGAQLSYYLQNVTRHEFEFDVQNVSQRQKRRLSLLILHLLVKDFIAGDKPKSYQDISDSLNIPMRSVRESLIALKNASLVTEIFNGTRDVSYYQPALDVNRLTLSFVIDRLDSAGASHKSVIYHSDYRKIDAALTNFETMVAKSDSNVLLRDL